ncbi:MAG TPA: amino acid adenylation domain-containing protein, partial [Ktedonobacteraceae bacterium]|nr:amino acid adenylation domain-containing protein [Ktedonobacteraceae bacterium]
FTNTVVFKSDLTGNPSFLVLLQRVQQIVVGALAHQELPFEFLVKDVQPKRTVSQISPLLQILFVMQPGQSVPLSLGDARGEALTVDTGMASFDLVLSAEERHDGLALEVQYRSDLFLEQTISRFLGHFRTLLEGAIANPHLPVAELPLLTQQEYQQIVFDWNTSHQSIADEGSVVALFECQVAQTPDAIALITCDGEQLTFGELNSRANQIANVMCQLGVGPEVNVGVCAGRSPLLVMALLAVLKAGGAYVPLDPIYPSQRLAFALENSEIKVLLTQQHLMSLFSHGSLPIVLLDADGGQFDQQPVSRPERSMLPQTLAYTIYTSGSTGQPKGVQVSNYSLTNFVSVITHLYNLHAGHRQLQFVSMGFDVFVEEIFPPLCCGASILLGLDPKTSTPSEIMDMIDRLGVTKINMTASYWHQLVDELLAQDKQVPTTLQILTVGAESPSAAKLHAWRGLVKHPLRMFNVYGPTETTVIASTYCIPDESNPCRIPIGKPVANTQLYLLDDHLQPVPVGIAGELYIGGDALARGYAMLPDVTAERFIPHPWDPRPGKRIYRTGDLARFLPDGNIEFLGRVDYQVKVRGFRIELEEIEAIVHKHPRVKECVVIALPDASNHLACYLVPTGQAPLPGELRQFLSTHLPDYMIPAHFIILPALPLSPNGKLDRQALPPPTADDQKADVVYIAPRTPVEQTLARIWAGVLGLERVGIHDNFFDAGGDSILSLQIVARARQEKLYLTPRHIFEYQTIAQLAPVARTIEPVVATGDVRSLEPELVPLSPIQCWFFEQELPNPHHWNQAMLLEVHLLLDKPGLETIFRYLLAQHRVFRLRFQRKERLWQQIMTGSEEEHSISLAWIDLSMLENLAEQKKAIESFAATMQTGLNITEGPLVSVALFHLGGQQADRLLIIIHHLIIDIVSWNILLEDLQTLCLQMTRGETLYLPPEITSFPMWASYLSSYAQSPVVREERLYWQQITRPPFVPLPVDHEQGANTTASVQVVQGSLSASETLALLHDVPSLSHTQVREALLTALAQTLIPWIGQPYLLVHLEGHGREEIFPEIDLSRTLGWFTSMFPVRLELPAETTDVGSALQTIKELLRQVPNKGLGYGVLRYLCPDDDVAMPLRTQPQAQVSFHYSGHQPSSRSSLFTNANEAFGPVQSSEGFRQHLFDILVQIDGNGQLQLSWFYSEAIYLRSSIEMLVHTYLAALRTLIAHCLVAGGHSYAPSDFPLAKLNRQQLGNILKRIGRPKEKKDV